ncbi:MAG: rhodanese-like domain-containing protein [Salibacteraceae bacterium]
MFDNLNAVDFGKAIEASPDAVLIDVRTPMEFQQGHLKGAILLDFYSRTIQEDIDALDKSKEYLIYCRSGARSASACNYMAQSGFAKVTNMAGGIMTWQGDVEVG